MNYTLKYKKGLLELIHTKEKELKVNYDAELYLHVQNMRCELRYANSLDNSESEQRYQKKFLNIGGKFIKSFWKPKLTI